MLQETEGPRRGGEREEEGGEAEEARAEVAGERGEEEPEEAEAAAGRGAEEAADEDRHGGEEAAAGSAQPGVHPAHCRAAGQGQGTADIRSKPQSGQGNIRLVWEHRLTLQ